MDAQTRLSSGRLPVWLQRPPGSSSASREMKVMLRDSGLNTVCEEARCPNIAECFGRGTATFMILGDVCTRGCRFCSVITGKPHFSPDKFADEAEGVVKATRKLGLRHVVVTSVARDDLEDGGAEGFYLTITRLREELPAVKVEVLVPDFQGNMRSVERVIEAGPHVFNHNLETVPRLYRRVRPGASYRRSLEVLAAAKKASPGVITKTGVMLGLGEEIAELKELLQDARKACVDSFTAGQYMQPTRNHLPVERYLTPSEFLSISNMATAEGFRFVASSPLVRSSYNAEELVNL
ncbi:MAG: lipoyl synthase [bacterium]|nr:lipoyl synthase [bacterium]